MKRNLPIEIEADFRERKVDSEWIDDFRAFSMRQWQDFTYKRSDGECLREVQERYITALNRLLTQYQDKNLVIGSHGTALSTIIHYYQPQWCFADFERIKGLMPWIVQFDFDDHTCVSIREYDLFTSQSSLIL